VLGNPIFKWVAPATAVKYQLQYATDSGFTANVVTSAELSAISYTPLPPLAVGTYYWHVKARDLLGNWGPYNSTGFKVNVLPIVPPAPVLTAPANALVTNDPTPTFTWNPVVSGNTYDIEIASDPGFTNIISTLPVSLGLSATSYTPTTNLPDGTYYWHVGAWNTIPAAGLWSVARSFTIDTAGPVAPALTSPLDTTSMIGTPVFKWMASPTATRYRFEYDTSSSFNSPIGVAHYLSGELTSTSYTPPTMALGTYFWHVQAKDAAGNWGPYTGVPFTVTINLPTPVAPVLLNPTNALAVKDTSPTFEWKAVGAAPYVYTYELQLSTSSTFPALGLFSYPAIASTTYTLADDTLTNGTTYYWRVQAKNSASVIGPWSIVRSIKIDTGIPDVPVLNLPADNASVNGTPTFSWKAAIGATKYQFQYDTDTSFSPAVYTSAVLTTTSVKPPTMSLGTYYWRVKAMDAAGNESAWSGYRTVAVTPLAPSGVPTLVSPINGSIVDTTTPTVTWKAVTGAVKYRVQMDKNSTFSSPDFEEITTSLNSTPVAPLADGTYYWRVRKIDVYGGEGAWSVLRRFSVNDVIPLAVTSSAMSDLSALAEPADTNTPTFTWDSVEYGVTYQLQVDDNNDFATPSFDDTADTTSRTPLEPLANGNYFWRVRAFNVSGTPGPWSETWTITINAFAPQLLTPAVDAVETNATPAFTWETMSNGVNYQIQVDNNADFVSPEFDDKAAPTSRTPVTPLVNGVYYWRVRSFTADDTPGAWSAAQVVTIAVP
jgi:hypothetical protein